MMFNIEDFANSINGTKEEKEDYYLKMTGLYKSKFKVVWDNDKIIGASPIRPCNRIDVTITVSPDGEVLMKDNIK